MVKHDFCKTHMHDFGMANTVSALYSSCEGLSSCIFCISSPMVGFLPSKQVVWVQFPANAGEFRANLELD